MRLSTNTGGEKRFLKNEPEFGSIEGNLQFDGFLFYFVAQNRIYIHIGLRYILKSTNVFRTGPIWDFPPMYILHKHYFSNSGFKSIICWINVQYKLWGVNSLINSNVWEDLCPKLLSL